MWLNPWKFRHIKKIHVISTIVVESSSYIVTAFLLMDKLETYKNIKSCLVRNSSMQCMKIYIMSSLAPSSSTTVVMLTHIVLANQQAKSHNWVALHQTLPQCIVSYVFKKSIQWIIQIYANLFNAGINQNNSKLEIVFNCYSLCNYQNKWNILLKGY